MNVNMRAMFLLIAGIYATQVRANVESESARFIALMDQYKSLIGNFSQEITDQDDHVIQTTEGELKLQKPKNFFWDVAPPFEQTVVGNENSLVIFDPDLEQANVYSAKSMDSTPALILSGDAKAIEEAYEISLLDSKKGRETYRLKPKSTENNSFEFVDFSFEKGLVSQCVFVDPLGQTTSIQFSEVEVNTDIDPSVFAFDPPPGTDIIINE